MIDEMIRIQMTGYPSDWSEHDKRQMAIKHLFGPSQRRATARARRRAKMGWAI